MCTLITFSIKHWKNSFIVKFSTWGNAVSSFLIVHLILDVSHNTYGKLQQQMLFSLEISIL